MLTALRRSAARADGGLDYASNCNNGQRTSFLIDEKLIGELDIDFGGKLQ